MNNAELLATLRDKARVNQDRLDGFLAKVKDSPSNMEWADSAFACAARLEVFKTITDALAPGTKATVESIKEFASNSVQSKAIHVPHSSSYSANSMDRERLAAWAEVLEIIRWG